MNFLSATSHETLSRCSRRYSTGHDRWSATTASRFDDGIRDGRGGRRPPPLSSPVDDGGATFPPLAADDADDGDAAGAPRDDPKDGDDDDDDDGPTVVHRSRTHVVLSLGGWSPSSFDPPA